VVVREEDEGYEKVEIEDIWEKIFKEVKSNNKLSEKDKKKLINILESIRQ